MAAKILNIRRRKLGMSVRALSRLSGVPLELVNRILANSDPVPFEHVDSVGRVLGVNFRDARKVKLEKVLHDRALLKAQYVARAVQGTQSLEAAGVDVNGYGRLVEVAMNALLSGKKRKLWDEE